MLYTKEQLNNLSAEIGKAIRTYHKAVADNLREIGKPVFISSMDDDDEGLEIMVEHDASLHPWTVNLIKWDRDKKDIMVHCCSCDYSDADEWYYLSELGDATDYVLEAIDWPEE